MMRIATACVVLLLLMPVLALAQALPGDAGVLNARELGAAGDGVTDDTEALRAAVRKALDRQSRYATPPFLYLPAGTYRVTGPIAGKVADHGWAGGWRAGLIVWGEDRQRTIIKLDDALPAYADPKKPQYVFATGSESDKTTAPGDEPLSGGGNRAFRHGFYNLTVDVGAQNPGAIGIDYLAHNRGAVENVTIRSSDPQHVGHTGLKLTRNWPGPCLYKNVLIEGFDHGIEVAHYEYGNVFEHITLRNQRVAGLVNRQNMLAIRNLVSENRVPAVHGADDNGLIVVVGGQFTGGAPEQAAVTGNNELYLRDITVEGYGKAIETQRKGASPAAAPGGRASIDLYTTEAFGMGVTKPQPLRLPIKETPTFWTDDRSQWVKPQQFMPPGTAPGEGPDWTDALQAALDDGRPVVYLPNGSYRVSRTLTVPPHVRLIVGFQSSITPGKDNADKVDPLVRFVGRGGEATVLEHIWLSGHVEHAAERAVALRHVDIHGNYRNTAEGTGDLFIEDTIGPKPLRVAHGQNVFARQLNIEFGEDPLVENHGGNLWLLGYKTEGQMICLRQTAGRTELLGALIYPLRKVPDGVPAFHIEGGEAALTYAMSGPKYPNNVISHVKGGQQILTGGAVGGRSAALVRVAAGSNVEPVGLPVEKNATDDGGIPFWKQAAAEQQGSYRDPAGHRWMVYDLGSRNDLAAPQRWKPLTWNAGAQRWDGQSLADQAPTYSKSRTLRGRGSQGKLVGIVFEPAHPGKFSLSGTARVDTWGPDGPVEVWVQVVGSDDAVRPLLTRSFADRAVISWADVQDVQGFELKAGERLLISFASEKGGTASLELDPDKTPTAVMPVK
jgi:hypothetical protein